jgi:hypothetical protein
MARKAVALSVGGVISLLLEGVKRNSDGSIKSGYVINGAWHFERDGTYCYAKYRADSETYVNRWADPGYAESKEPIERDCY